MVSIAKLVEHLKSNSKEFVVCLTFDDGYKDNLTYALPILESYEIPATIYVTTRFAEGETWMWWFELWDTVQNTDRIVFQFDGEMFSLDCDDIVNQTQCFHILLQKMMMLPLIKQKQFLAIITGSEARKTYSKYCSDWNEVHKLDKHPLITIGAHTHSHPILALEEDKKVENEILYSKKLLEKQLGHRMDHFAYPFGTYREAGPREYKMAKIAGLETAVTTNCHKARPDQLLCLPRLGMKSTFNQNALESRISGLCNALGHQLS